jgi:putative SOS response-associated peptidase YedK
MCHRYIQTSDLGALRQGLAFTGESDLTPRHNIRPSQKVPVLHEKDGGAYLTMMRWGLAADSMPVGSTLSALSGNIITELDAASFTGNSGKGDLTLRRCLIPADGFYECERRAGGRLQPWLVRLIEDGPFCFAGVWQANSYQSSAPQGDRMARPSQTAYQCALLTVADNGTIAPIAEKVPVILAKQDYAAWLDPTTPSAQLQNMLKPYRDSGIYWHPVSSRILETEADIPALAEAAQLSVG